MKPAFSNWKTKDIQRHLMSQMWHQQQKNKKQGVDLRVFGVDMI